MQQRTLTIRNRLGLHARAAAKVVKLANGYESNILLARSDSRHKTADARSIFGILMLAASQGTVLEIIVEGPDDATALGAMCQLIESGFGEE
ncbi:MAG: HPr family phosphocarrier protein [Blastocatellia bacterium]